MTNTIIHGDARQTGIQSAFFHCVATSPPYFGLRNYGVTTGQIGIEKTPSRYIDNMRDMAREVWRVLRDDGTWWLNLGDSFGPGKSLFMIPQRVALALQADGWIIRAQIPWVKANCMPESVQDRPTVAHEYVFLLAKSQRYFWDADAVRMGASQSSIDRWGERVGQRLNPYSSAPDRNDYRPPNGEQSLGMNPNGRNLRTSDFFHAGLDEYAAHLAHIRENGGLLLSPDGDPLAFLVNPVPNKLAHFAMWPPRLVAPMIKASTSEKGCCPKCGAQWRRIVERSKFPRESTSHRGQSQWAVGTESRNDSDLTRSGQEFQKWKLAHPDIDLGFSPSCKCNAGDPAPCRVLDPFAGSGTTMQVAEALGRDSWGVELMAKNIPIIGERLKEKLDPESMKLKSKATPTRKKRTTKKSIEVSS